MRTDPNLPKAPTEPQADARYGWLWAVLPAGCERVRALGDAGLVAAVRAAGMDGVRGTRSGHEATVLARGGPPSVRELDSVISGRGPRETVVVALNPYAGGHAERPTVLGRLRSALASGPRALDTRLMALRVARRLRHAGLATSSLSVGESERGQLLGRRGGLLRRRALPMGAIVTGRPRAGDRFTVGEALARAEAAAGRPLERGSAEVLSTGTVMVEMAAAPSERYLLRVAAGPAAWLLERSAANIATLGSAGAPAVVRERLVAPVAQGRVGAVLWTLEPKVPGANPTALDAPLWEDCLEFLLGLQELGEGTRPAAVEASSGRGPAGQSHEADVEAVEPHLSTGERRALVGLAGALVGRLAAVPRGWAHGDFSPGNLVVDEGRLRRVLDWDSAAPEALPVLDLMHLIALSSRRTRSLPHGARVTQVLWPMARAGGDEPTRRWCAATGVPRDAAMLQSLVFAYWLARVARDLRTYADRPSRRTWMEANVHRPLRELELARR